MERTLHAFAGANIRQRLEKRAEAEAAQQVQTLINDLLPVIDNLEAALAHADTADPEYLRQGVELTLRLLLNTLAQYGVTPIEAEGKPFDPRYHEAVGPLPNSDVPEGHVAKVLRKGYMLHDRLLRPAKVLVAA
ncbi:MAG: nucleotide exchange factor GrpE [Chloroflexi bacterium]|nr:nucleotide exchange factor GrpE [Chloroflexota bacterium]